MISFYTRLTVASILTILASSHMTLGVDSPASSTPSPVKNQTQRIGSEYEYDISMITLMDQKKAEEVMKELKHLDTKGFAGLKNFSKAANKDSIHKIVDGSLGYIRLEELPEVFRDPIMTATKGTIIPNVISMSVSDPKDESKKITVYNILRLNDKRSTAK